MYRYQHDSLEYSAQTSRCLARRARDVARHRLGPLTRIKTQSARDLLCAAAPQGQLQHTHPVLQSKQPIALVPTVATAAVPVVFQWLWVDSAAAATVCLNVPDWLVDPKDLLFHSPVVAVGVAGLALILFPKLIRTAINYLAIPAILTMLAYAAVSFPEQTANSVYTVLEFVKEHPTAASVGIIITAGALLGPDLLAGTAVAGVLLLLAVNLGILQFPQLPQLPKVPGQALLSQQLNKASRVLRDRLDDLDDSDDARDTGVGSAERARSPGIYSNTSFGGRGEGLSTRMLDAQAATAPAVAAPAADAQRAGSTAAAVQNDQRTRKQNIPAVQQQQQQQQDQPLLALTQKLGSASKTLGTSALEQGKAASTAVLQKGQQLKDSGTVQHLSQQTADAARKAAAATKKAVAGLWQRGLQLGDSEGLEALKQGTAAAAGRAAASVNGLRDTAAAPANRLQAGTAAPGLDSQQQGQAATAAAAQLLPEAAVSRSGGVGAFGSGAGKSVQEIDAILANS